MDLVEEDYSYSHLLLIGLAKRRFLKLQLYTRQVSVYYEHLFPILVCAILFFISLVGTFQTSLNRPKQQQKENNNKQKIITLKSKLFIKLKLILSFISPLFLCQKKSVTSQRHIVKWGDCSVPYHT